MKVADDLEVFFDMNKKIDYLPPILTKAKFLKLNKETVHRNYASPRKPVIAINYNSYC